MVGSTSCREGDSTAYGLTPSECRRGLSPISKWEELASQWLFPFASQPIHFGLIFSSF
jgi:hypothetical protein